MQVRAVSVRCDAAQPGHQPSPGRPRTSGMLSYLVAAGSGLQIMLLHADVDEGSFALRRQVVSDVLALRNASIHLRYEEGTGSNEPVDGVYPGLMSPWTRRRCSPVRQLPARAAMDHRRRRRRGRVVDESESHSKRSCCAVCGP